MLYGTGNTFFQYEILIIHSLLLFLNKNKKKVVLYRKFSHSGTIILVFIHMKDIGTDFIRQCLEKIHSFVKTIKLCEIGIKK